MVNPIDLRLIAGDRIRITLDESAKADTSRDSKLWCTQIPAKYGHIGTYSDRELSAYCSASRLFARLLTIPTVRTLQRGDSEIRVAFDPQHLDWVAAILNARRKRTVTDEQRSRLAAIGTAGRFARHREQAYAASSVR